MIVKLKCIDNGGNNFLTSGKVYDGIIDDVDNFAIVDDDGDLIRYSLDESENYYGKWGVINE